MSQIFQKSSLSKICGDFDYYFGWPKETFAIDFSRKFILLCIFNFRRNFAVSHNIYFYNETAEWLSEAEQFLTESPDLAMSSLMFDDVLSTLFDSLSDLFSFLNFSYQNNHSLQNLNFGIRIINIAFLLEFFSRDTLFALMFQKISINVFFATGKF